MNRTARYCDDDEENKKQNIAHTAHLSKKREKKENLSGENIWGFDLKFWIYNFGFFFSLSPIVNTVDPESLCSQRLAEGHVCPGHRAGREPRWLAV